MSDPRDYFDVEDVTELAELIALLVVAGQDAVARERYAAASACLDYAEDLQTRLTWLCAYEAYGQGKVS